jgi:multidrug resistance efflux pump
VDFRYKALQKQREPDELDAPTMLAAPRGWVAVFVVSFVMAGAVIWGFLGTVPLTVSATGLLSRPDGVAVMQSPVAGVVDEVRVSLGETVDVGEPVARIVDTDGERRTLKSLHRGVVVAVATSVGQVVGVGTPVVSVEPVASPDRLVAMLFLPADRANAVAPGQPVMLAVSSAPAAAFGLLRGTVESVSPYPMSTDALVNLLGDPSAVATYAGGGAPRLVVVSLQPDPATVSGYGWTTPSGPPAALQSQVPVIGTVSFGDASPASFVLGR